MDVRSATSLIRKNIPFYLAGALLLLGMKYYYSCGNPDSLSWILAPTVWWVSALSKIPFTKVPRTGYVSHSYRFIIAASCSGLQFLMISMTALVFSYIHRMRTTKGKIGWMFLSAFASYLLTIFVNGFRILFSIFIPIYLGMEGSGTAGSGAARAWSIWLTPERLHTIIGAAVYFTALSAICRLGEYASRKCFAAPGTFLRENSRYQAGFCPTGTLGGWAVPAFWYFSIVLGIPFLNRAYRNRPETFTDYALLLTAVCLTVITFHCILAGICRHVNRLASGRYHKNHNNGE